jgi:hypothetical protein
MYIPLEEDSQWYIYIAWKPMSELAELAESDYGEMEKNGSIY